MEPDERRHFGLSAALSLTGYGLTSLVTDDDQRGWRLLGGAGLSLSLGVAKEVWDALGHGDPSWGDLGWDLAGTAVGVLLGWGIDALIHLGARR